MPAGSWSRDWRKRPDWLRRWPARADGARIAVSGSWTPQRLSTLKQRTDVPWDLLVLNEKEAAAACGQVYDAPRLLSGVAASVVVTLGAAGAYGVLNGEPVTAEAIVVPALDTTGAGDAFCAGLLAALIRGQRPACTLAFAACAAAHLIGQRGDLLHDPARIRALVKEIAWRR
jgi:ribokinase